MADLQTSWTRLREAVGVVQLDRWSHWRLSGRDALTFLHNMTTNDVKALPVSSGCESFATDVKGHTIGHFHLFRTGDEIQFSGAPGQAETLITAWDRYVITEDVEFEDQTEQLTSLLLIGPDASQALTQLGAGDAPEPGAQILSQVDGLTMTVRHLQLPAPVLQLSVGSAELASLLENLQPLCGDVCAPDAWEAYRIVQGWPLYGVDISSANLPQEVDRNNLAISFTKGCYLGQETVARLDALGHVNRRLMGLKLPANHQLARGAELVDDGKTVATITSLATVPGRDESVALAYVRRGYDQAGRDLPLPASPTPAQVADLPLQLA